ncbi:hypothetical protein Ana3638_10140 [Anaerocolumna sedimenticola]|uniref:Glycoside hydrolase family 5 domain-containing protein n=1 Tax=Anaerocolumna sedimenticola TaxID=2696063 RepID=A0A6P1TKX8_9FIRM|nr:glycoside hydrolase family 5 protein [Anaerocolumna sedimenticola]QHQ61083.1 hypothetical protein Ana3638_10140 [Anaerocolumna sedimenticola]
MSKTHYEIIKDDFYINGKKTYSDITGSNSKIHGLLFNNRFIQGIFEDRNPKNSGKYDRFGKVYSAEENTESLIRALKSWYDCGIRAITVGLQGGGPIYTYSDWSVINTGSFSPDGKEMDEAYKQRLIRVIKACDEIGMLVIVSFLYQAQEHLLNDGVALMEAVKTASKFLSELNYTNVIIEVANEHDVGAFSKHPLIHSGEGIASLIRFAREWSQGKFAVGSSGGGGICKKEVIENSDVILIHGNGLRRQELYDFIRRIRKTASDKPIVCNEDSQMFGQLSISVATHTSWGYYNNMTKQEPPADWGITKGEDEFYAERLKQIIYNTPDQENEFYLQGFEDNNDIEGRRYIKLASRYPEKINYVEFYEDEKLIYTSFAEPFMLYSLTTWEQEPYSKKDSVNKFSAKIYLHNGEIVVKDVIFNNR